MFFCPEIEKKKKEKNLKSVVNRISLKGCVLFFNNVCNIDST